MLFKKGAVLQTFIPYAPLLTSLGWYPARAAIELFTPAFPGLWSMTEDKDSVLFMMAVLKELNRYSNKENLKMINLRCPPLGKALLYP